MKASGQALLESGVKRGRPRSRTVQQPGRFACGTRNKHRGILVPLRGEGRAAPAAWRATSVRTFRVPFVLLQSTEQVSPCLSRFLSCDERPRAAMPPRRPNRVPLPLLNSRAGKQPGRHAPPAGEPSPFSRVRRPQETWKDSSRSDHLLKGKNRFSNEIRPDRALFLSTTYPHPILDLTAKPRFSPVHCEKDAHLLPLQ